MERTSHTATSAVTASAQHVVLHQGDQRFRKPELLDRHRQRGACDYTSLTYILGRLRAVDGDGEDFEMISTTPSPMTVAKAYWDARTQDGAGDFNDVAMNWGPSFRRAMRAIKSMSSTPQRRAACAQDLRD